MAIIIINKTTCSLCGQLIQQGQNIISFTRFVPNELDPLRIFDDLAFHEDCFNRHPLSQKALVRRKEIQDRMGPGHRLCIVCKKTIVKPNEYFAFGHLVDDQTHPLYKYNYAQFHRACLKNWSELAQVYKQLDTLKHSGVWRGKALDFIFAEIQKIL